MAAHDGGVANPAHDERSRVARLVEATPADRDRFVDFVRAASLVVVMLGHWTVAVVIREGDTVTATNVLGSARWLQWGTWLLQVMPLFFFVGGFSNLRAIEHEHALGGGYPAYLRRRLARLMRPTLVFVGVWLVVVAVLDATSLDPDLVRLAGSLAAQPLWFLAVYLMVVALAPPMAALHRRRPAVALVGLTAAVVVLDVVRFGAGHEGPAMANYVLVFLFAQQVGFFYGDGRLTRVSPRALLAVAGGALVGLWLLTTFGPYPVSMVGVPDEAVSNMSPPTLCIVVLTLAEVGLVMAARPAVNRWLAGRRPWSLTVAVNARIMTLFLWHLTALVVAAVVLVMAFGLPTPAAATGWWWLSKPLWIATAGAVLALLVATFGRAEDPRPAGASRPPVDGSSTLDMVATCVGLLLVVRGLIGLALDGFSRVLDAAGRDFAWLSLSPVADVVLILLGYTLVEGLWHRHRNAPADAEVHPSPAS